MTILINYQMSDCLAWNLRLILEPFFKGAADRLFFSSTLIHLIKLAYVDKNNKIYTYKSTEFFFGHLRKCYVLG